MLFNFISNIKQKKWAGPWVTRDGYEGIGKMGQSNGVGALPTLNTDAQNLSNAFRTINNGASIITQTSTTKEYTYIGQSDQAFKDLISRNSDLKILSFNECVGAAAYRSTCKGANTACYIYAYQQGNPQLAADLILNNSDNDKLRLLETKISSAVTHIFVLVGGADLEGIWFNLWDINGTDTVGLWLGYAASSAPTDAEFLATDTQLKVTILNTDTRLQVRDKIITAYNTHTSSSICIDQDIFNAYDQVIETVTALNASYDLIIRAVDIIHGEADKSNPLYDTYLEQWQRDLDIDIKAITGQSQDVDLWVNQVSSYTQWTNESELKQLSESISNDNIFLIGPTYHLEYGSGADEIHLTGGSLRYLGEMTGKGQRLKYAENGDFKSLYPVNITYDGNITIDITFHVPVGELVLDTSGTYITMTDLDNYGFVFKDDVDAVSISAVQKVSVNTIRITLSGIAGVNALIGYAIENGASTDVSGPVDGARGCLRDQDSEVSEYNSNWIHHNWCVIFREAIN